MRFLLVAQLAVLLPSVAIGGPEGAPGIPHQWAPALKEAVGTAYESEGAASPVWFTVAEGILSEVFYPQVDQPQIGDLQFVVTDGKRFFSEQKRDTLYTVRYADGGATVLISGKQRQGRYEYEQAIITDTASPVVRVLTRIRAKTPGLRFYVLLKPAVQNSGAGDLGVASSQSLVATEKSTRQQQPKVHVALVPSIPFAASGVGYVGFSDGWQDLSRNFRLTQTWKEAGPGNIALTGEVPVALHQNPTFEIAIGFGTERDEAVRRATESLQTPFDIARDRYEVGWRRYFGGLQLAKLNPFVIRSAMIVKTHEDKIHRGAIVASLSKPAPSVERADDGNTGGYHLVWPRDLYHAGMGLLAAGDRTTPLQILEYYAASQKSDGSWFQNYWLDGTPYWTGLQMDEVAFPILFVARLQKRIPGFKLKTSHLAMVKRAANFLASHGPVTHQDRWEEVGGFVPSTLAAEIAALEAASRLTGDAVYASVAQDWSARLESWTLVRQGPHGSNYYLRTSPQGRPNDAEIIELANGAGRAYASEIVDGGFLELVRLGVRRADDPAILSTLAIYESPDLGIAANGSYRRYNRDRYGANDVGGFWPLLAGERGHHAVALGDLTLARARLGILEGSALESGVIPEQTSLPGDGRTAGAGIACPLVWAHAEDILLHRSIDEGVVFDRP